MTFDGISSFSDNAEAGVQMCSVISCFDETLESCGQLLRNEKDVLGTKIFEKLDIEMPMDKNDRNFYWPITFDRNLMPLKTSEFFKETKHVGNITRYLMGLRRSQKNLMSFAILARIFDRDFSRPEKPTVEAWANFFRLMILQQS